MNRLIEMPIARMERGVVALLLIGGVAALVVVIYGDSFSSLAQLWQFSDHRHGVLVFPISAYLLWRSRDSLGRAPVRPWALGMAPLGALVLSWLAARALGIQVAEHVVVILLIPAAVAAFLGVSLTRLALFPLLFLLAAVPWGDWLIPYLMQVTADVAAALLRVVDVPVFREGQFLTLPGGTFEVADVCSGLRFLISGTMVALLFAYVTYRSNLKRVALVAVTAVTMVLANGVRAFVIMFVASATNMRYLAGRDHVLVGWLLFGVIIVALLWIGARFADDEPKASNGPQSASVPKRQRAELLPLAFVLAFMMLAMTARPLEGRFGNKWIVLLPIGVLLLWVLYRSLRHAPNRAGTAAVIPSPYRKTGAIAVVFLAGGVLWIGPLLMSSSADAVGTGVVRLDLPAIPECTGPAAWSLDWRPNFESADFTVAGTYRCADVPVSAFVAVYRENVQGSELVSDDNSIVPAVTGGSLIMGDASFETGSGRTVRVNELEANTGYPRSLIWYWYAVGKRSATSAIGVKLLQAYELLTRRRSEGRVYLLQTPLDERPEASRRRLTLAARALAARIDSKLGVSAQQ